MKAKNIATVVKEKIVHHRLTEAKSNIIGKCFSIVLKDSWDAETAGFTIKKEPVEDENEATKKEKCQRF
ncbi:hypothetical protein NQ318_017730 [Aromia moschata]|uniref:Uncharacterized protein n=1 Tax=Aromia moschata TaxID=1265417 RepID=A0AAV8XQ58_9CUCU|nr:hypothetical protein NQ318_017730 [Aromia moschata]